MKLRNYYKIDNPYTFATLSYTSMALIHLHRPSAAEEAFATLFGSKSGLVIYVSRIFCITGTCNGRITVSHSNIRLYFDLLITVFEHYNT